MKTPRPEQAARQLNARRFQRRSVTEIQAHVVKDIGEHAVVGLPYPELTATRPRVCAQRLERPRRRSAAEQRERGEESDRKRYERNTYSLNAKQ